MRILSFDVGIKNLSYCDVQYKSSDCFRIFAWDVVDITKGIDMDIHCMTESLIQFLHETFLKDDDHRYDHILIENQPVMKNPTMKSIQMVLYTTFKHHKFLNSSECHFNVHLISPLNKNKCLKFLSKEKATSVLQRVEEAFKASTSKNVDYLKRKRLSVEIAKELLISRSEPKYDDELLTLSKHKKQDDLADTLNQALHFVSAL